MPSPVLTAAICGLGAAATYGTADFFGGVATKRDPVLRVVATSHALSLVAFTVLAVCFAEPAPSWPTLGWGAAAGLMAAVGAVALYSGLATGPMSVVAATTSLLSAAVPISLALVFDPAPLSLAGIGGLSLAAIGIVLLSLSNAPAQPGAPPARGFLLGVIAGFGFGLSFAFFARVPSGALFWPLVAARIASVGVLAPLAVARRTGLRPRAIGPIMVTAAMDSAANLLFVLAAQTGRTIVAAVLVNLYPAFTVLLALFLLHERPDWRQWTGLAASVAASILIALRG